MLRKLASIVSAVYAVVIAQAHRARLLAQSLPKQAESPGRSGLAGFCVSKEVDMDKAETNGGEKAHSNGSNRELTHEQLQEIKAEMLEHGKSLGLDDNVAQLTAAIVIRRVPYEAKE